MHTTFLLLGSNMGDSKQYIADAIYMIGEKIGKVEKQSSLYQTASWGKSDQPDFINQAIELRTELNPESLLKSILEIEKLLGRQRSEKWGSRTIDIDILLYEDQIIDDPDLKIPHPFLPERRFALMPLHEIAPDFIHSASGKTIEQLLLELTDELFVKKLS
ncbi:2-amino-4-hydroxy-6-hydroxymethyldihydropteridine diphosphokinase [Daejeonella sp. H1SJ63]|jgi:2-amino-4-hydroxy-6-hydroxymethyldihydropteridine diphosphokinase|uniref:2-amino-4-hydroxy-6- hydroxymethyldihydropteridine diphosphokinase n=1 Tax=Daejeonella sp. H1SJ63 TaxID=3034145 RepID=UPI0023EC51F9|nr:2-amino-4-hydroxy-6-hydroxymethyldihydropteridine diphosphokinase [Daejeonella sp. H1SJ63]